MLFFTQEEFNSLIKCKCKNGEGYNNTLKTANPVEIIASITVCSICNYPMTEGFVPYVPPIKKG